jgi:hypothetical protein
MKAEWIFQFECAMKLETEYLYEVTLSPPVAVESGSISVKKALARIVPKISAARAGEGSLGELYIELPGDVEQTKPLAIQLSRSISEQITFSQGRFTIHYALMCCRRIPETEDEEFIVGDRPFWVNVSLQAVPEPPVFDPRIFSGSTMTPETLPLIAQFNDTRQDKSPIRQYLGYFRIIESVHHSPYPNISLESALSQADDLHRVYSFFDKDETYDNMVKRIVKVRNKCAHLKLPRGFGYTPLDPAVETEVRPLLELVAGMARSCLPTHDEAT